MVGRVITIIDQRNNYINAIVQFLSVAPKHIGPWFQKPAIRP